MRVVLVGPPGARARLRAALPPGIEVVGDVVTMAAAQEGDFHADAWLIAPEPPLDETLERSLTEPLTTREIEVLTLLADGLPNKSIAGRLGISDQTVKFHVAAICGKLSAANRTDAVRRAIRRGLIPL
jgi:DNA-binding NarL/FixJ family response regulator